MYVQRDDIFTSLEILFVYMFVEGGAVSKRRRNYVSHQSVSHQMSVIVYNSLQGYVSNYMQKQRSDIWISISAV